LNSQWKPEYNGCLELWNNDMSSCAKRIAPISNRLVIFRITDDALHGSPEKWQAPIEYPRLSLALYYYTNDRPDEEKQPFHWALWYKRHGLFY
jgi:Rps23 Pro-64 3,4-dihydroxylase Tpa1-like proline 4-hydroxylase